MKRWILVATLSLMYLQHWPAPAQALGRTLDVSQYAHTSWTTRDGQLQSGIRTITQTADGYLWLGTEFGLVRFDGVRFVNWTPPSGQSLPTTNIRSLVAAPDGTLWIGTLEGLASWRAGQLRQYPELAKQNVLALLVDKDATVWAGTFGVPSGRLCAIRPNGTHCFGEDGSFGQWVWALYEDRAGRLWVGAETGLWRWKPGAAKRYALPTAINTPQAISETSDGNGPIAIAERVWQLIDDKPKELPLTGVPDGLTTPVSALRDGRGALWIGTLERGILRIDQGNTSVFAQGDGLSSDRVHTFFEDREHNLWVGTADGLDRFHEPSVLSISMRQGLSSPTIWSVLVARDNSGWLSTLDGLNRWIDGHVTVYRSGRDKNALRASQAHSLGTGRALEAKVTETIDRGLPDDRVGSLYEDQLGRIWVSTPGGIARFHEGKFAHVTELPPGWVNAITGDGDGGIWVSYQDLGLIHWNEGKVIEKVPWSTLGVNGVAASIVTDPRQGGLWVGFFEGGLLHFKDGQVRIKYQNSDGLGNGRVTDVRLDEEGTVWAATEGGLSRLQNGRISTLTRANGLPCDTVHWTIEADNSVWMYTACGLLQVPLSEMQKWSADPKTVIHYRIFDNSDGVRSHALLTGYTPHVSKSRDGRLWFAHFGVVSIISPQNLELNTVPPPVYIEQLSANGKSYPAISGMRLPARIRDLTVDYTALSFSAPEKIRFKYKLEGQDPDWREVINHREVQYSNLSPGTYRFHLIACNNSGVWNEKGDVLQFSIAPAYYQTNWFRILCSVIFCLLLWAAYQLRMRRLHHEFEATLDARVDERTRIARDLHDTLLQSFQGLLLRFQAGINMLAARPSDGRKVLEDAVERASQAIAEGRDAVSGLRRSAIEKNDLAAAIETIGEEIATTQQNAARLQVLVEGTVRDLHPILRDEIYRVATEALRNAFRHSAAKNVEVEIRYDMRYLRLRVRDDGKGIDPEVVRGEGREGHFGLHGMRERARLVGGKLTIWTELDSGTEIELIIPAAKAYLKSTRTFWHFGKRNAAEANEKETMERE